VALAAAVLVVAALAEAVGALEDSAAEVLAAVERAEAGSEV
jgi:hypothetical protein